MEFLAAPQECSGVMMESAYIQLQFVTIKKTVKMPRTKCNHVVRIFLLFLSYTLLFIVEKKIFLYI